jgi:hypothetical protein
MMASSKVADGAGDFAARILGAESARESSSRSQVLLNTLSED